MTLTVIAIYASILVLMLIALSTSVSALRGQTGISILHGENIELAERIRRHGNFAENVPFALVLMAIAEVRGAPHPWLHAVGATLVLARVLHARGLRHDRPTAVLRILGGAGTQIAMLMPIGSIAWGLVR